MATFLAFKKGAIGIAEVQTRRIFRQCPAQPLVQVHGMRRFRPIDLTGFGPVIGLG